MSVDLSGPRTYGRWPSDGPEATTKRALYFLVGACTTYTEDEAKQRAKVHLAAAGAAGCITSEPPLTFVEDDSLIYYARPHREQEQRRDDRGHAGQH